MAESKTPIVRDPDKGPPYPLPWTLETKDGDNYIRDATGQAIACDMQYYPWIYSDAMPLIVRAVNCHQDLVNVLVRILNNPNASIGGAIHAEAVAAIRKAGV